MPKNNGPYPDIPEGNISLTNRELERLRQKYGDAALEPDEGAAAGLEEPLADLAPTETGITAGGDDPVPEENSEPSAAAQDLLPELEPEPVREEEPESVDDTTADYSGFFAGADELLGDLAPDAAAEAFARYIGGLSFDTHRGEMTAEAEWPGPVPAAVSEPSYTVIQPLPADEPDNGGAENKRPARAKKPSFFSGRKARGANPRSSHPAGDAQLHSGAPNNPPGEDPDDTGLAAAVEIDEPAGLAQPFPAQVETGVSVETATDTDELDFTKKYLGYTAPDTPDAAVSAAEIQDSGIGGITLTAPAAIPGEAAAENPLPAEENIVETVVTGEDASVPASAQETLETVVAESAPKPLSFWQKRKQRNAPETESIIVTAQPPAEQETAEPTTDSPAEEGAPVDTADVIPPEVSEPIAPAEPSALLEEIAPQTQEPMGKAAEIPAETAISDETAAEETLPADENTVETILANEDVSIPELLQEAPEMPAADSVQKKLSFWEKRKQRKALNAESIILTAQPPADPETVEPSPDNPAQASTPADTTADTLPEAAQPVPLPETPAPPEEITSETQEPVSEVTELPAQDATSAPPEETVPATQEPIVEQTELSAETETPVQVQQAATPTQEPVSEVTELTAQDEAPVPAQDTAPEALGPIGEADELPAQAAAPAQEEPINAVASDTAQESPAPEPQSGTAAAAQETSAESGEEPATDEEDTDESDIADTVSGEALEAEKPPAENIQPKLPVSQPQSPPNAGMRIIYRAPEAAALDADSPTAEPAGNRNDGKTGPAGISPYQKYIRVIYQAPGGAFHEESEAAQPQPEQEQTTPAEDTTPQAPEPEEQEASPPPAGEEGTATTADTAQDSSAKETAELKSLDEGEAETDTAGIREPDGKQAAEEPIVEQAPGTGILNELAAEKKLSRFKRFLRAFFPQRGDSAAEKIRKSVLVLATLTIFVCGGILLNSHVIEPAMSNRQIAKAIELKKNSSLDKNWPDIQSKYSGVDFPQGMLPRYAGLYVANRDFAGWLTIEALGIDMPLVQGETNGDYLRTDFYGKPSRYGCCFFDYRNSIQALDRNTIVYGHNMGSSDLLMFGNLEKYSRIDGFKTAPVIECNTIYALMKWKVYAVFVTNALPSQDNGYLFNYIFPEMENDEDFAGYIAQLDRRKLYTTGVDLLKSDRILTLSTCSYAFDDARLVIVARLVRPGESEKVDTSLAAVNPSPKYPQLWYTKNGQKNPYQNDEKWYP